MSSSELNYGHKRVDLIFATIRTGTSRTMPAISFDRYQLLRSQILANAYLVYPNKNKTPRIVSRIAGPHENEIGERRPSQGSTGTANPSPRNQSSRDSLPSSLVDVEIRQTHKRDLEVAICRHRETLTLDSPQDVFYAVVFDKNECSGFSLDEQHAQITKQRHKLRGHVLTTNPEDACGSEEDALIRLCERLERDANAVVLGDAVITRLDDSLQHPDTYRLQPRSSGDQRAKQRDSLVAQCAHPGDSHASFIESQIETEEDSESQQQRLLARAHNESFHEDSPPAFETMRSHTTRPTQALKPNEQSSTDLVARDTYSTQPTQAVYPGNEGPYHHQLRRH